MNIKKATLLGMFLAFGLSICSTYAVTVRDNFAFFRCDQGMTVSFEWNGSYCITANQPWGDSDHPNAVYVDNKTKTKTLNLDVWCGRQKSSPVADYFNSLAPTGSNTWGSSISSMNFAIQGTLTINSDKYFVVIGQLSYGGAGNQWVIGGQNFRYNDSHYDAVVTPDGKYLISIFSSDSSFTVLLNTNNAQSN